ncbi:sensor histidine kinase [Sphingomonas antarctica]|uniref:sensor histidine kinase n=1 Tax=Sphingomonas antarctica TaxID=2040274 RepID=UPI0039E8A402
MDVRCLHNGMRCHALYVDLGIVGACVRNRRAAKARNRDGFRSHRLSFVAVVAKSRRPTVTNSTSASQRRIEKRIAERDAALAALELEREERERTEDMLRQSQKMEAVGQLTGGIAHDFNNLLTVIVANVERARRLVDGDERVEKSLSNAMTGAERAATLTDRLLAFSRRQPLQPAVYDLNIIVTESRDLLEQSLGTGIKLSLMLAPHPMLIETDRNQTENALLNLAINARDAMPVGGQLTISTDETQNKILLSVKDTGEGMSAEVIEHVFEPFFTTKAVGHGTGLGLSQVYGFAKQSGGDVTVDSTVGGGTTVSIIFAIAKSLEGL